MALEHNPVCRLRTTLTLPNGVVMTYTYDQASELSGITYKIGTTTLGDLSYTYDAEGRRATMGGSLAQVGLPQVLSSATYDAANELTQWDTSSLTYDANGNLTADGVNTYTWNARNQLSMVKDASTGTTLASFQYDAFGRRTENAVGNAVLYDGVNAVQELSGATPVVNRLTGGVDEFFSRTDSAGTTFPLTDALGSTIALTDSSGAIQTQYSYEPFGATTATGATSSNWYQFTGRENDGTGLYYYRARYYSPRFQRFVSEDPAGLAGGINFYAYAGNRPVNFKDPFGLKPNGCQAFYCGPNWLPRLGVAPFPPGMNAAWQAAKAAARNRNPIPTEPRPWLKPEPDPRQDIMDAWRKGIDEEMKAAIDLALAGMRGELFDLAPFVVVDPRVVPMPGYGGPLPTGPM